MYRQSQDQIMAPYRSLIPARIEHMARTGRIPLTYMISTPPITNYVPTLSARLEDDRRLTHGARRCTRKLAEYTYRRDRHNLSAPSSLLIRPDSPQTFLWPPGSSGGQHCRVNELFQEKPMT
jgi:hypothetical protein